MYTVDIDMSDKLAFISRGEHTVCFSINHFTNFAMKSNVRLRCYGGVFAKHKGKYINFYKAGLHKNVTYFMVPLELIETEILSAQLLE